MSNINSVRLRSILAVDLNRESRKGLTRHVEEYRFSRSCPHGVTDNASASGAGDPGSIPGGGILKLGQAASYTPALFLDKIDIKGMFPMGVVD